MRVSGWMKHTYESHKNYSAHAPFVFFLRARMFSITGTTIQMTRGMQLMKDDQIETAEAQLRGVGLFLAVGEREPCNASTREQ